MTRRSKPYLLVLTALLLSTGFAGCNRGEQAAETQDQSRTEAPAPGAPSTPGGGDTPAPAPGTAPGQEAEAAKPVDPNQLPAVVAKIGGQEIKKEELVERAQEMRVQLARMQGVQVPPSSAFYREILDGMIAHHLLLQEAKQLGISVTDAEAEQMLRGFKSQFPSEEAFQKQLAANKMTEADLRKKMQQDDDSKVNKLIETRIMPTVQVSEADARTFYDKNQARMKTPPQVHLRHILIKTGPEAREKAEGLLAQLKDGGDFAKLAAENSDDPGSKARGGDLSWVQPGQTVPEFEKAAFALKQPNDLSSVVQTQYGYHIIQLLERREGQTVPFEQAKNRIGMMLRDEKMKEALRVHVQELKTKGNVEVFL